MPVSSRWSFASALLAVVTLGSGGCGGGGDPGTDSAAGQDGGTGIVCGALTCDPGEICCIDCDGSGLCGPPGTACPGVACLPSDSGVSDAGVTDAGMGIPCAATTCDPGQVCCIDCDGTGLCGPPGSACPGAACPPPTSCPPGTCRLSPDGQCEKPTGQLGNGCCACGEDDLCSAFCMCAAPDTSIATPAGDRPIAELQVGDLVYSVDHDQTVAVPVLRTYRARVRDHRVVRARLANGSVLEISPRHPTADGRELADLRSGDLLDGVEVVDAAIVAYPWSHTYDILPGSETGAYFAGGVLIGSTLASPGASPEACGTW